MSAKTASSGGSGGNTAALLIVDVQYDFCPPDGALAVPDGTAVISAINALRERFPVVATSQDWHPSTHVSFADNHLGRKPLERVELSDGRRQVLWPVHCVQGTKGAQLHAELRVEPATDISVKKGSHPDYDAYSAFRDDSGASSGLAEALRERDVDTVYVCGLAYDYCVGWTAAHAVDAGFRCYLVEDATRGIARDSCEEMRARLAEKGVKAVQSHELLPRDGP